MTRAVRLVLGMLAIVPVLGIAGTVADGTATSDEDVASVPGLTLPIRMSHRYRMSGRIRPLLFWIGRDRVGFARVAWRQSEDGAHGYDFLVGTDPAVAPRSINRWGYIAEEIGPGGGTLLAMMSSSEESSFDEAKAATTRQHRGAEFKALWNQVGSGLATSRVARVQTDDAPTIHDVGALLGRVRVDTARAPARQRPLEADVRPGFLCAVAELVQRSLEPDAGAAPSRSGAVRYVFGQHLYELRIRNAVRVDRSPAPLAVPAWRAMFEITNPVTNARTDFDMTYGAQGDLAGVPLFITWQPRWWLKVELHLETETDGGRLARTTTSPQPR